MAKSNIRCRVVSVAPKTSHVQATFTFIGYDWAFVTDVVGTRRGGLVVRRTLLFPLISIVLAFSPGSQAQEPSPTLKKVAEFDLPGPPGKRFDYLTIDSEDYYLISAHLAAGQTYVIDLRTNKVVATVADTPGAEGVEYVAELRKFYTSNAADNTIGVVDLRQMKVVKKLPTDRKPDGSAYAAPFHKLYVSDKRAKPRPSLT